jgi:hypothetical protein
VKATEYQLNTECETLEQYSCSNLTNKKFFQQRSRMRGNYCSQSIFEQNKNRRKGKRLFIKQLGREPGAGGSHL